ncbi:MAG: hypothetical protein ACR2JC_12010 [Chloroflexota bacterium]|nr:MAG: hypothetical protein DLM70_00230 [Chloroflexota bacterium]
MAASAVLFVATAVAFLAVERNAGSPMLPLGLFADSTFTGATAVGLLINLGFYGELFVINLYFQQVRGYIGSITVTAKVGNTQRSRRRSYT